jgi:hypothetical protein
MHGLSEDTPLWRVTKFDYVLDMLNTRTNVLVKPFLWEDPFENFLGNSVGRLPDGTLLALRGIYGAFYGQCWTSASSETDATSRIYAPDKNRGVRIRVSAGKLFDTIFDKSDRTAGVRAFLAPVRYLTEANLVKEFTANGTSLTLDPSGLGQARALSLKREAFTHEHEVRLLYSLIDVNAAVSDTRAFPCDPYCVDRRHSA